MAGGAKAATIVSTDLTELSLEELMNIEITSVSKKPEKLADAAAAIFVITQEDIRRSGVTCIPEALRMVPGINVARIDSNKWA
ncbi:MAG: TonB-dependent receptor plug domain-containing protein, partial [Deltaproteobacteria bacterium]|nr:TonB-dependent receptor plug domain-containing protein [Deltaproteobacteria bacterium]